MKKIVFWLLIVLFFTLIACSAPLEGFGVKPAVIENASLSGEDGSLTVTWQEIELADSYKIFLNTSETIPDEPFAITKKTLITIPNLLNDVTYYVWVIPFNDRGEQAPKMVFSGIIPLSVPQKVILKKTAGNTINVNWQAVALADEYEVFCKTSPVPPVVSDTPEQIVSVNSAILSGLNQPEYYIWIKAKNNRGKSALSGMVKDSITLSVPLGVTSEKTAGDTMKVNWQAVALADEYEVFCKTSLVLPVETDTPDQIVSVNSAIISGLDQPEYYIWIKAINSRVKSALSVMRKESFTVQNFKVSAVTENGINLEWIAMNEARGYYNVYRATEENGTYDKIHSGIVNNTKFIDTDITRFTTYYYKVSATIGNIEAIQSNSISVVYGILVPGSGFIPKLAWLQSNAVSNNLYCIEISVDENIGPQTIFYSGKSGISITLNGDETMRNINLSSNGSLFTIGSGVKFILDNNVTLKGRSGNNTSLVFINGGILVMNAGAKITGNTSSSSLQGGGVYMNTNSTFIMNDGEISGNTSTSSSSGYYAAGGGVDVDVNGTFIMNGGKISGNNSSAYTSHSFGSGVFVKGTFTMNGGEISGNTSYTSPSYSYGGGVSVEDGTFIMNDGKISGNTTTSSRNIAYGGGVDVNGTFIMNGGEISGNTVSSSSSNPSYGGGVYLYSGTFRMCGGIIYGNNATAGKGNTASSGAAFYKYSSSSISQYGTFTGNNFYKSGDLSNTNNTIRIVNGNLQTN
jgi:methyl coenzyme M reductase subunit C